MPGRQLPDGRRERAAAKAAIVRAETRGKVLSWTAPDGVTVSLPARPTVDERGALVVKSATVMDNGTPVDVPAGSFPWRFVNPPLQVPDGVDADGIRTLRDDPHAALGEMVLAAALRVIRRQS